MARQTKKINVEGKTYKITQHPATEGCAILERYWNAIYAFGAAQETIAVESKAFYPIIKPFRIDGKWLALNQFFDKIANPDSQYEAFKQPHQSTGKLTVREVLDGKTLADRVNVEERVPTPLSYPVSFAASSKQDAELDYESVFDEFLRYITLDGEQLDYDSLTFSEMALLLGAMIEYNYLHLWNKDRWQLPQNYSSGASIPRSLETIGQAYSQSNVIYNILKCSQPLATMADLSLHLSVEDAYDANETALRIYFEEVEMNKEAQRQAKNNNGG
ncbi:hypothetical protein QUC26_09275 [Pseudomonas asiatica]|uniref:hypothetical protein n=1 Tax=Pseudomonas asiatica TaxID=2219225 RepID=UPI0025A00EC8|nr:hypothetical protein [Pseudomonas asiatica]WJM55319.1 hypothetical protein QUC26_09275 [Pseudomonas asiatica]